MVLPPPPITSSSLFAAEDIMVLLSSTAGDCYFWLWSLLCVKGKGNKATFYIVSNFATGEYRTAQTGYNLGNYSQLLNYGIARGDQSGIFNLLYLANITLNREVELLYQPKTVIKITSENQKALRAMPLNLPAAPLGTILKL